METNQEEVMQFLQSFSRQLEEDEEKERKEATRFNPFQFVRTNENGLSEIFAFLLNPKENHGKKEAFLSAFLKKIGLESFLNYKDVKIYLEKILSNNRRCDIFIEGKTSEGKWAICIENKIRGAVDQERQMDDYLNYLSKNYPDDKYCVVYIPPFYRTPSEKSILSEVYDTNLKEGKIKIVVAGDIVEWLQEITIDAENVKSFVLDLIRFIKEKIIGDIMEHKNLVERIILEEKNLYAALQVLGAGRYIYEKLWNILYEKIEEKCKEKYSILYNHGWRVSSNFKPEKRYMGMGFSLKKEEKEFGVYIEFNSTYYADCYYGFGFVDEISFEKSYDISILEKIKNIKSNIGANQSKTWPLWIYFDNDLRNWENSTWQRIHFGNLADEIIEKWKLILDIFVEAHNNGMAKGILER